MTQRFKPVPKSVLSFIASGVELTAEQKARIKEATGVDLEWVLFHRVAGVVARETDPSHVAVTRLTYCWLGKGQSALFIVCALGNTRTLPSALPVSCQGIAVEV